MLQTARIKRLDNQLANQIAAGEVIERPASVVKELLENSIDAGATRIEVDIHRGGTRLIRITDNGAGIDKEDLILALTRHATSKIDSIEDLAAITSLGFRGEALASISSVSKLILTSRTQNSDLAWQAIAHGREMQVEIQPAAAIPGTRIEVGDLFFNTPARQKFLRTEKTEFNHIETIFKHQALSHFSITFILKHNDKIIKRVPACNPEKDAIKRIAMICGKTFADNSIQFQCQHESIQLNGWLGKPEFHRSESDIQYIFINQRQVKDKTLNHAIRQAYEGLLPAGRMSAYVIFLNINPHEIDVNVHPTKHEVRFSQQRLVHDLLFKSISDALSDYALPLDFDHSKITSVDHTEFKTLITPETSFHLDKALLDKIPANRNLSEDWPTNLNNQKHSVQEMTSHYSEFLNTEEVNNQNSKNNSDNLENPLVHVDGNFWISQIENKTIVFDALNLLEDFLGLLIENKITIKSQLLLFPENINVSEDFLEDFDNQQIFQSLGFIFDPDRNQQILLRETPYWLSDFDNQWIFEKFLIWSKVFPTNKDKLLKSICSNFSILPKNLVYLIHRKLNKEILKGDGFRKIKTEWVQSLFKSDKT